MRAPTAADLAALLARPAAELNAFTDHLGISHFGAVLTVSRSGSPGRSFLVRVRPPTGDEYVVTVRTSEPTDADRDAATLARWDREGRE